MYHKFIKRIFDIIGGVMALVILSPVMLILVVLVRTKLGSPVFFCQRRVGYQEQIFTLYKFRTMTNQRDKNGLLLEDDKRCTKFGNLLRSTSLDELPELINIIKGEMSFIGPRPLLMKYLPLYNHDQRTRHLVRPGLSGLAQIRGRNSLTWDEKFALDQEYVKQLSFWLDLKIFALTIVKVFQGDGIHSKSSVTMEEFRGNSPVEDQPNTQQDHQN